MSLHRERGAMVVEDLRALPSRPLIVAEGSPLPAWAISSGVGEWSRALWLLPTAALQRDRLLARAAPAGARALYLLLREQIEREASEHAVQTLELDGSMDTVGTANAIERLCPDALAARSFAATLHERRALLRGPVAGDRPASGGRRRTSHRR